MASSKNDYREIKERSMEVCRDFVRSRCSRSDLECRFAHPPNYVEVRDGRVIVCFDFTKNRCKRTSPPCKYFHPPDHLLAEGAAGSRRNDDYYGSNKPASGGGGFGSVDSYYSGNYGLTPYLANALGNYKAALDAAMPWMGGGGGSGGGDQQQRSSFRSGNGGSFDSRSDKIEVCREFKRSKCNRDECRFAHPPEHIKVGYDNYVTYCMDFVNGRCSRDTCRYFHPPPHIMDRLNRTGSSQGSGKKRPFKSSSDGPAADGGAPGEGSGDDYESAAKKVALDYGYD